MHYNEKYLKNDGCFYHRIKPLSKCSSQVDLLVAFVKIESIINTSTILSTQGRINRIIPTSHLKMGTLLESMKVALSSNKAFILVFEA